jgi:hypothetical protein
MKSISNTLKAISFLSSLFLLFCGSIHAETHNSREIKTFQLDENVVYHLKVGVNDTTTVLFPGEITAIQAGADVTATPQTPGARFLVSYMPKQFFFGVRALQPGESRTIKIIYAHMAYTIELSPDKEPYQTVTFYYGTADDGHMLNRVTPDTLLGLLTKAKAYDLLKSNGDDNVADIATYVPDPMRIIYYPDFHVIINQVFRFDEQDTLVFRLTLQNESAKEIYYDPTMTQVRVGDQIYPQSLVDMSGILPPGHPELDDKGNPKVDKNNKVIIDPGAEMTAYLTITGTPRGGRNNLAVDNRWNILLYRIDPESLPLPPPEIKPAASADAKAMMDIRTPEDPVASNNELPK